MADTKKKYVSEFEIKSNVDEATKKLEKFIVGFSKLPSSVEDFNKSLKKNVQLEKQFFDMMSAIPNTIKRLSDISKIKLVPRKELTKLSNMVGLIEDSLKNIQGKTFDTTQVQNLVSEFENVNKELLSMERRHSKLIEKTEVYNNLVQETSKLQKILRDNSGKFLNSTNDIRTSYNSIRSTLASIGSKLKKSAEEGTVFETTLKEASDKLDESRSRISNLNRDFNTLTSTAQDLSKRIDDVVSGSSEISKTIEGVSKLNFDKTVKQVESLRSELQKITNATGKTSKEMLDDLNDIRIKLEDNEETLNFAAIAGKKLGAETKTVNDALNLMVRISNDITEEMKIISNTELASQFAKAKVTIDAMNKDLQETIFKNKEDVELIRQKMGLLKLEADKLSIIVNRQNEIKKLEEQSISMTVKRAREQNEVNKAYIKQILNERRNLGGLVDAFKVYKKNIPIASTAKLGETGLASAKIMTGAFKMLGAVLAPFMGAFSLLGMVKQAFALEKQIKGARKQILTMAANTHTAGSAFDNVRKGGLLAETTIEGMRKQTEKWAWSLGVSMEQAIEYMGNFNDAGFSTISTLKNLEDFMVISQTLGMDISKVATDAGSLRAELGMSLSDIGSSFVQMQKDAKNAGITTSIFFDKVINAATGLGLYGKKIDDVSDLFGGLVKNMKLPEKAATDAAGKIIGNFKDLSNEAQITIYRLGGGAKLWEKTYKEQVGKIDNQINGLISQEKELEKVKGDETKAAELNEVRKQRAMLESQKRTLTNTNALKGVNSELEKGLMMTPNQQFLMQMGFLAKKAAGIDITGGIENVQKAIEKNVMKMKVVGAEFGIDRETVETMRSMASNLAENSKQLNKSFGPDDAKGIIEVLSSTSNVNERASKITQKLAEMSQRSKDPKDLKKMRDFLKTSLPSISSDLSNINDSDLVGGLGKVLSGLDVNFKALSNAEKDTSKDEAKRQARQAGLQALKQTKSTEDAINNTIGVVLRKIFTSVEKLVGIISKAFGLGDFASISESIYQNVGATENIKSEISSKENEIKLALGDLEGKNDKDSLQQVAVLKQQLGKIEGLKKATEEYSSGLDAQRKEFEKSGKITEESKKLAQKNNFLQSNMLSALKETGLGSQEQFSTYSFSGKKPNVSNTNVSQQKTLNERLTSFSPNVKSASSSDASSFISKSLHFADGGVVPGNKFFGDKVLAAVNSGEAIVPKKDIQGVGQKSINDNRVINIYVNQNDRQHVEQIVLNALYTDKMFK